MEKQRLRTLSNKLFKNVTRAWFVVTFTGQLIFAYYILMLYWKSTIQVNFEKWNSVNPHFFVKSDITGNIIFGLHVLFAAIITILGPLQLVGYIRRKAPKFHRVSGRIYIFSAFLISIAGLYLTWIRSAIGGPVMSFIISVNAVIIITSAFFTIKHAINRNIRLHNQWAVHLFVAMSGVWLFRVFFMLWMIIHQAPVGFDPQTFTGPFLTALSLFVYIFPQVIVALYFKAKFSTSLNFKLVFSALLTIITICITVGIFGATMGMWLPGL